MLDLTKYKGFLFDVDGTLVDSNDQHAKAFVDAFREKGRPVSFETIRPLIGMGGEKLIPAALGTKVSDEDIEAIGDLKSEFFEEKYFQTLEPFPQTRELIAALKACGYRLAVASSASREELTRLLQVAQVNDLFDAVTSADDAEHSKPSPDILQAAIKKLGCAPAELVMVGDTPYDLKAAAGAGVKAIAFRSGGWSDRDLSAAIAVFDGPADLLKKLST